MNNMNSSDGNAYKRFFRNGIKSLIFLEPCVNEVIIVMNLYKSHGHNNIPSFFLQVASSILFLGYAILWIMRFNLEYFH